MNNEFNGKLISDVNGLEKGSEVVVITFRDGSTFRMWHSQDCCESVSIVDIDSVNNIEGAIWYGFEESTRSATGDECSDDSGTWTFYTLHTSAGYVWIRWLGESNGYYSEDVSTCYCEAGETRSRW